MSEKNKDAAIKLFGMTIPLQPPPAGGCGGKFDEKEGRSPKSNEQDPIESSNASSSSSSNEINKPTPTDEDSASTKNSNLTEHHEAANDDGQLDAKTAKKPDKILPCPRCKSSDTKFCYFNNYNVNQPRHFCKNCQRYWTAGGTMRNVPVGAGRRKSKSSSLFRRITVDVVHHPGSGLTKPSPGAAVLSFEKPLPPPVPSAAAPAPSPCFPIPFLYPAAGYWSCGGAPPGPCWSLPWLLPAQGKRSREDYEREEATRGSVWAAVAGGKGGAFQPKENRVKSHRAVLEAPLLLHSNPAALARSLNFQETI